VGRPREQEIGLTEAERRELEGLARSPTAPRGPGRRARIVLASADRRPNTAIARELGLSVPTVAHWRGRFLELGLAGLYDEHRPGRPRTRGDGDEEGAGLLAEVPRECPARGTRRTARTPKPPAGRAEALARYERELGEAAARWSGAGTDEQRRAAARDALVAAWELSHGLGLTTAAAPLLALAAGLDDLGNGRAPDWMRPTNVGGTSLLGRSERWAPSGRRRHPGAALGTRV
jgi:hypothetical protein